MVTYYMKSMLRIVIIIFALIVFATRLLAADLHPLAPPDTSSPRATLRSFLDLMRESRVLLEKDSYLENKALQVKDELLEEQVELLFDFREYPIERVEDIANYIRPLMIEILDRIELPPEKTIPDAQAVNADNLKRWTIPYTEITLIKIDEGSRQDQWVFSSDTIDNLKLFYDRVKHLPYRHDAVMGNIEPFGGPYQRHILLPEETFPDRWINHLPVWARAAYFENSIWKWVAYILILSISTGLFFSIVAISRKIEKSSETKIPNLQWWRILPPVSGAFLADLAEYIIDEQINAVGIADVGTETVLWMIALIFKAWAIIELGGIVSRAFIRSWQLNPKGVNHYLTAILTRIMSVVVAVWIVIDGIEGFGISIIPLIAGIGVGGIAIALAVRPTLENLIGGIILFIDKPVEVGELCRYSSPTGSQTGIVEKIGLRSTRLRKYEDTLITIPNAEFSQLQIENLSSREMTLMQYTLSLRYETTADQMRYVLTHLRKMMIAHPKVSPERLRIRFLGFGDSSLDIEVFAYIKTNDYPEYWAIREDVNLRIVDIVNDSGTGFAFPSQTTYVRRDLGLDDEKSRRSEAEVESWRSKGNLPFPDFEQEEKKQLSDTLDYPPIGSPEVPKSGRDLRSIKFWKWNRHQQANKKL